MSVRWKVRANEPLMTCRVKFELLFVFDVVVFSGEVLDSIKQLSQLEKYHHWILIGYFVIMAVLLKGTLGRN